MKFKTKYPWTNIKLDFRLRRPVVNTPIKQMIFKIHGNFIQFNSWKFKLKIYNIYILTSWIKGKTHLLFRSGPPTV